MVVCVAEVVLIYAQPVVSKGGKEGSVGCLGAHLHTEYKCAIRDLDTAIHALVIPRIDCCDVFFMGPPLTIWKVPLVQNAAI